jgi:hypothetical protein
MLNIVRQAGAGTCLVVYGVCIRAFRQHAYPLGPIRCPGLGVRGWDRGTLMSVHDHEEISAHG